jgi:hypothetical protein
MQPREEANSAGIRSVAQMANLSEDQKPLEESNLKITDYPNFMSGMMDEDIQADQLDDLKTAVLLVFFSFTRFIALLGVAVYVFWGWLS